MEPKFKELWDAREADFVGGQVPDNKYPMFTFTIRTQEIYCNVSLKDQKIVDGAEDRIMYCVYNFVLTLKFVGSERVSRGYINDREGS